MKSKNVNFEYIEDLIEEIIARINNDEDSFISVFAKYEQARDVIKELLMYDSVKLDDIELCSEEGNDYTDEYIIDIWSMDGIVYVGCEPAKRDGEYFNYLGDICYLFGDCNSRIMNTCSYGEMYDVEIGDNEECEFGCDCDCNQCCSGEQEPVHGFTISKNGDNSYYKLSYNTSKELNRNDIYKMLKDLGFNI